MRKPILCLLVIAIAINLSLAACAPSPPTSTALPAESVPAPTTARTTEPAAATSAPPSTKSPTAAPTPEPIETPTEAYQQVLATTDATQGASVHVFGDDVAFFAASTSAPTEGLSDINVSVYQQDEWAVVLASDPSGNLDPRVVMLHVEALSTEQTILLSTEPELTVFPPVPLSPGRGAPLGEVALEDLGTFQSENELVNQSIVVFVDLAAEDLVGARIALWESPFASVIYGEVQATSTGSVRPTGGSASLRPIMALLGHGGVHWSGHWGKFVEHLFHPDVESMFPRLKCYWRDMPGVPSEAVDERDLYDDPCAEDSATDDRFGIRTLWRSLFPSSPQNITGVAFAPLVEPEPEVPPPQPPTSGTGTVVGFCEDIEPCFGGAQLYAIPPGLLQPDELCGMTAYAALQVIGGYDRIAQVWWDEGDWGHESHSLRFEAVPTGVPLWVFVNFGEGKTCPGTKGLDYQDWGLCSLYGSRVFTLSPGQVIDLGSVGTRFATCH